MSQIHNLFTKKTFNPKIGSELKLCSSQPLSPEIYPALMFTPSVESDVLNPAKEDLMLEQSLIIKKSTLPISKQSKANKALETKKKQFLVLQLIIGFGLSTQKVASYFIDDIGGYIVRGMLKDKLLKEYRKEKIPAYTKAFQAEHQVLTLTELGLRIYYQHRGQDINYPELNPSQIKFSHASHTLEIQMAIKKMFMHNLIIEYQTERMMDPENKLGPKKFDAVVTLNIDDSLVKTVGIEVELSAKYDREMCETRKRVCNSLRQIDKFGKPKIAYVFYFCEGQMINRYQGLFSADSKIYHWLTQSKKDYKNGVDLVIPKNISDRILFFPIQGLNTQESHK